MENKFPCERHEEQIKTLFKKDASMEKGIEKLENEKNNEKDFIHSLDKNMAVQTELLKSIVEHNNKQDARMDKQEKRLDEQHEVIVNINENLTELTEGQRTLNNRVGKLEDKVEENEDKNIIDLRDINKEKNKGILAKYAAPFGVGLAVGTLILEIIKIFK